MDISQPFFWMNGVLATDLIEITDDSGALDDGGFWAVSTTFEGRQTYAKFANVIRGASFPEVGLGWLRGNLAELNFAIRLREICRRD